MSYPPLPSNGQTNWGATFRTWADALEGRKVEGQGMSLRRDTSVGTRVFLDQPGYPPTLLMGDTGWRDVQSLLAPGWAITDVVGRFWIRLTTHSVDLYGRLKATPDAEFIGLPRSARREIIILPSGFSMYPTYVPIRNASAAGLPIVIESDGPARLTSVRGEGTWEAGDALSFTITTSRYAGWPTTLPGTPV